MNTTINVALIGATGKAGSVILDELLCNGYSVKALVRTIGKLSITNRNYLTVIEGNINERERLLESITGASVIINASSNTGNKNPISSLLTRSIIDSINGNTLVRYFVITGKTVKTDHDQFSFITYFQRKYLIKKYPEIMKSKQEEYRILKESNAMWTMIRCPRIVDGECEGYSVSEKSCKGKEITKKGLARFIIDEIKKPTYLKKAIYLYK